MISGILKEAIISSKFQLKLNLNFVILDNCFHIGQILSVLAKYIFFLYGSVQMSQTEQKEQMSAELCNNFWWPL